MTVQFYANLEVNYLLDIIDVCLAYAPTEPLISGQKMPPILECTRELITILTNAFTNHEDILYLNALVKFLSSEIKSAMNLIDRCLQLDPELIKAHILMARICIYDKNYKTATKCLDDALLLNFQVRISCNGIGSCSLALFAKRFVRTYRTFCASRPCSRRLASLKKHCFCCKMV